MFFVAIKTHWEMIQFDERIFQLGFSIGLRPQRPSNKDCQLLCVFLVGRFY